MENILLDKDGNVKLADLGLVGENRGTKKELQQTKESERILSNPQLKSFVGTLEMMAPELLAGLVYNEKVDIWALGLILLQLVAPECARKIPNMMIQPSLPFHLSTLIHEQKQLSNTLRALLKKMLNPYVHDRYNIVEVLESEWVLEMAKKYGIKTEEYRYKKMMENKRKKKAHQEMLRKKELARKNLESQGLLEMDDIPVLEDLDDQTEEVELGNSMQSLPSFASISTIAQASSIKSPTDPTPPGPFNPTIPFQKDPQPQQPRAPSETSLDTSPTSFSTQKSPPSPQPQKPQTTSQSQNPENLYPSLKVPKFPESAFNLRTNNSNHLIDLKSLPGESQSDETERGLPNNSLQAWMGQNNT